MAACRTDRLLRNLGLTAHPERLEKAILPAERPKAANHRALVVFNGKKQSEPLSVRHTLAGKNILLIGVTGFIGKVWLAQLLNEVPQIGKIYLLIRRQRTTTAQRRFEKIFEESPVFDPLQEQLWRAVRGVCLRARRSRRRRRQPAGTGDGPGDASATGAHAGPGREQLRPDGFQSGPSRSAGEQCRLRSCT